MFPILSSSYQDIRFLIYSFISHVLIFTEEAIEIVTTDNSNDEHVSLSDLNSESDDKEFASQAVVPTTIHKIFETNSSFHAKQRTTGKVQFLFCSSFLLALTKFSFWEEDWALGYNSMKF